LVSGSLQGVIFNVLHKTSHDDLFQVKPSSHPHEYVIASTAVQISVELATPTHGFDSHGFKQLSPLHKKSGSHPHECVFAFTAVQIPVECSTL
jgi:hypothetical protein